MPVVSMLTGGVSIENCPTRDPNSASVRDDNENHVDVGDLDIPLSESETGNNANQTIGDDEPVFVDVKRTLSSFTIIC